MEREDILSLTGRALIDLLGIEPYEVQYLAARHMIKGRFVDMKTGEGKTIAAVLAASVLARNGSNVHIITANDYLASRDQKRMQPVYKAVGLRTALIYEGQEILEKQHAYASDVVYGTLSGFGFDYLRDQLMYHKKDQVQRGHLHVLVDEADQILIDDARTPLSLVSLSMTNKAMNRAKECRRLADDMIDQSEHAPMFVLDQTKRSVQLTESGITLTYNAFNLHEQPEHVQALWLKAMRQALFAEFFMKKERDYLIKSRQIILLDEASGRLLEGRQHREGLQEAVGAKEGIDTSGDGIPSAEITVQNYINLYLHKSGMSGTIWSEKREIERNYGARVVRIKTHHPLIRQDELDRLYADRESKHLAVIERILREHQALRPVLVGIQSIEESEALHKTLTSYGLNAHLLTAKEPENEAKIVEEAGKAGAITLATNMAGRGTDIVADATKGGLLVIGTSRHHARRVDDQLRGRAGRQGDPGSSAFYLSLDDDLPRMYGHPAVLMSARKKADHKGFIRSKRALHYLKKLQRKAELDARLERDRTAAFGLVDNALRKAVYAEREHLLNNALDRQKIINTISAGASYVLEDMKESGELQQIIGPDRKLRPFEQAALYRDTRQEMLDEWQKRERVLAKNGINVERHLATNMLHQLDSEWQLLLSELSYQKTMAMLSAYTLRSTKVVYGEMALGALFRMKRRLRQKATDAILNG